MQEEYVSGGKTGMKKPKPRQGLPEDLSGKRFGMLTVLNSDIKIEMECEIRTGSHCKCDCGATLDVVNKYLKRGSKINCGSYACAKIWKNSPEYKAATQKARREHIYSL